MLNLIHSNHLRGTHWPCYAVASSNYRKEKDFKEHGKQNTVDSDVEEIKIECKIVKILTWESKLYPLLYAITQQLLIGKNYILGKKAHYTNHK